MNELLPIQSPTWWAALENLEEQWPQALADYLNKGQQHLRQHLDQLTEQVNEAAYRLQQQHPNLTPEEIEERVTHLYQPDNPEATFPTEPLPHQVERQLEAFKTWAQNQADRPGVPTT